GSLSATKFGFEAGYGDWWGDLAELLVFDRALTPSEVENIEDYLTAKYELSTISEAPLASSSGGLFTGSTNVTLTSMQSCPIYYTTDGTEPTTSSTLYTGAISITQTTTLKAKSFCGGLTSSTPTTLGFTNTADSFQPGQIANLKMWLRADAGVPDGSGSLWQDQSGNGNDAGQSVSGAIPTLVQDVVNGLPAMRFNPTNEDQYINFSSAIQ